MPVAHRKRKVTIRMVGRMSHWETEIDLAGQKKDANGKAGRSDLEVGS